MQLAPGASPQVVPSPAALRLTALRYSDAVVKVELDPMAFLVFLSGSVVQKNRDLFVFSFLFWSFMYLYLPPLNESF